MRTLTYVLRLLLLSILTLRGVAGPLEDGEKAMKEGDYATALKLLKPLAEEGIASAQVTVGSIYFRDLDASEDLAIGVGWFRKAADQGFADAQAFLGHAYLLGHGINQDYKEAMKWFQKAAEQGNYQAQHSIGAMYAEGLGVRKNLAEAKKWREKSRRPPQLPKEVAEGLAGTSAVTLYSLQPYGGPDIPEWDFHGHHILGRSDLAPDQTKTAIAALHAAISAGDTNWISGCMFNPRHALSFKTNGNAYDILICYQCSQLVVLKNNQDLPFHGKIGGKPAVLNGLLKAAGIPLADTPVALQKSYAAEAKVALKMAEQGDVKAQDVIARMLMSGRGVKRNEAEGIQWLAKSRSATQDQPNLQFTLGEMYYQGVDVKKDDAKALKYFQQAAAQGSTDAKCEIAFFHDCGIGVPKSAAEAVKLYREAAESGNPKAQYNIGVRSAQGRDIEQNYTEALQWLRKAADQAFPEALHWMGTMYERGWGVPKDPMEAYFWDQLAVAYGTIYGSRVSFHPSPEQRVVLDKRVADWVATHPKQKLGESEN